MVKTSKQITFTEEHLKILNTYSKSRTAPKIFVQRARILINLHNNEETISIAKINSCSVSTVFRLKRKIQESVKNLQQVLVAHDYILSLLKDRNRSGKPPIYKIEDQNVILATHCKGPKEYGLPGTTWTYRRLRSFLKDNPSFPRISISFISKLNKRRKIIPHKVRYYLTSKDPLFEEKTQKICTIYKALRDGALKDKEIISVDEKTHIQALKNIREDVLPTFDSNKKVSRRLRDPEYKRMGNINLIAGTNLRTGKVYGKTFSRNRTEEFFAAGTYGAFLEHLNNEIDQNKIILIIADNYKTHSSKKLAKELIRYPNRFEFVFIPTHCSWMNPIEGTFSKLQRGYLRNLRVDDLEELEDILMKSIEDMNLSTCAANWDKFIQRYFNK